MEITPITNRKELHIEEKTIRNGTECHPSFWKWIQSFRYVVVWM